MYAAADELAREMVKLGVDTWTDLNDVCDGNDLVVEIVERHGHSGNVSPENVMIFDEIITVAQYLAWAAAERCL